MTRRISSTVLLMMLVCILVGSALVAVASVAGRHVVFIHLLNASVVWLVLLFASQILAYWAYTVPYRDIYYLSRREAITHAFEGFQPYRPWGGFVYDMNLHKPSGGQVNVFYLSMWEYAVFAPLVLIAAITAYVRGTVNPALTLPWIIGVPAGAILFMLLAWQQKRLQRFPKLHKLVNLLVDMLRCQPLLHMVRIIVGMLLYWIGECVALWAALQLFRTPMEWTPLVIAYATGYAVTRRSLPLGGAGVVLVAVSFALYWVGAPLAQALLAALAYQISNLLMPILVRPLLRSASSS
ncbi:MAG TPA: lysylphosphatidylglycerol synthase domain-containing protein [Candidatus Saccharimonadales bacterium]|nr:lysylphosphatidylglycerol synthase domain-containing protein [Candidatus Saccharimonadales bacterium]